MSGTEDLTNRGVMLNRAAGPPARTIIVTGQQRSGTSLVASMLQRAGLFIGSRIDNIVYEDGEFVSAFAAHDAAAVRRLIAERNAQHARWGFKCPMLCRGLQPGDMAWFDRPRVVVTFRDPVAVAVRTSLADYRAPMQALQEAASDQAAMLAFAGALTCPTLLVSYEKALSYRRDFIATLLRFCDIPPTEALLATLLELIEPSRARYVISARRRFEGLIEGVRSGQLYGWCQLTQSPEPIALDVLVDDRVMLRVVADAFRQDLQEAGIGTGRHGFFVDLARLRAQPDAVIRVRIAEHGVDLARSGTRLCDFGAAA